MSCHGDRRGQFAKFQSRLNSSSHSAKYMRQWTRSALVQVMACLPFGAKPLPEPNTSLLPIWLMGTHFSEFPVGILSFPLKMHLTLSSAKVAAISSRRRWVKATEWLYLPGKWGIKTKMHFEWVDWHRSSLYQLSLEPTQPNGLVSCKVPTDLVKIIVKEPMHTGFYYVNSRVYSYCVANARQPHVFQYAISCFITKFQEHHSSNPA